MDAHGETLLPSGLSKELRIMNETTIAVISVVIGIVIIGALILAWHGIYGTGFWTII